METPQDGTRDETDGLCRDCPPKGRASTHEPVRCIIGETIREVRIWTEDEWELIDPAERPSPAVHVPGMGWVAPASNRHAD